MVRFAKHNIGRKVAAVAAVAAMGSLLVSCAPSSIRDAASEAASSASSAAPVSFACEPSQRAVMHQVLVNGMPQQQMSCESTPVTYPPGSSAEAQYAQTPYVQTTQFAPAPYAPAPLAPATHVVTREVVPERVVYQRVPERHIVSRPKRSVGTSALIVGSSAAGGAGLGALIGGKKGAGIGALAGGGAAALWDQITRHK